MKDRRTKKRHSTAKIQVSSATLQGQVLNLSMDGLAIETATRLRPGKKLSLKIDGEGSTVTGSVKWSKLSALRRDGDGESQAIYQAGIAIEQNAPTGKKGDKKSSESD